MKRAPWEEAERELDARAVAEAPNRERALVAAVDGQRSLQRAAARLLGTLTDAERRLLERRFGRP